jgi:hypothetical protein
MRLVRAMLGAELEHALDMTDTDGDGSLGMEGIGLELGGWHGTVTACQGTPPGLLLW